MIQNNVKRIHHQNKAHAKISWGLQICRQVSEAFNLFLPAYIFNIIFSEPKDSLMLARTAWFISFITGLMKLLG